MKKIFAGLTVFFLLFVCSVNADNRMNIGVILFSKNFMQAYEGFKDGLHENGYNPNFIVKDINGDLSKIKEIMKEFKEKNVRLIFLTTSIILLEVDKYNQKYHFKILFNEVAAPETLKTVQSEEITGVTHEAFEMVPKRMEWLQLCFPNLKKVYYFFADEDIFKIQFQYLNKILPYLNFKIRMVNIDKEDISKLKIDKNSALFMGVSVKLAKNFSALLNLSKQTKSPIMAIDDIFVQKGAVIGYSAHFYEIGKQTALMAIEILNGIDIRYIPYQQPFDIFLYINKKQLDNFNLKINKLCLLLADRIINE